jgi:hypothetical protein
MLTRSRWCADDLRAARGALKQSLKNSLYDYQFVIDELTYRIKAVEAEHDDRMTELDHDH